MVLHDGEDCLLLARPLEKAGSHGVPVATTAKPHPGGITEMADKSGSHDHQTVAIDSIPHPIAGYRLTDGDPVIRSRNAAFEKTFETVSKGTTVRDFIDRSTGADAATGREFVSSLTQGAPVDVAVAINEDEPEDHAQRYRLQRLDPVESIDPDGYILFTPQPTTECVGLAPDRIASVISHDLRNPLDVANAHLRAARTTGDEEHFDEVERSHDRMEQIIRDVLTLARDEQAVDISDTVEVGNVAANAWSTVETDGATITVLDDLPAVRADPDRLKRLFENLYRNSIEHAQGGETAEAADGASGGQTHEADGLQITVGPVDGGFFVADDGRGIPPADHEHVFEPGYTGGGSAGGTGLGLTIVAQIAQAHDWECSLANAPSGGARFEFHVDPPTKTHGH